MSCIDWPRTLSGLCSPSAHSTASVTFDFPQPFGPTITLTPGEKTSLVRSGKDLKPLMVIELRCIYLTPRASGSLAPRPDETSAPLPKALQGLFGGRLLGRFLGAARAMPEDLAVDARVHLEHTVMRRTGFTGDLIPYAGSVPCEALLERRLEVQQALGGELDLHRERRQRRRGGRLEPVVQIAGADHRLADRGEGAFGGEQRIDLDAAVDLPRPRLAKEFGHAERLRHLGAGAPRDRLPMHLRQPPDVGVRESAEQVLGHREAEDAVAEEGEPPVRVGAMLDPRGVGERLAAQRQRQAVEELTQARGPRRHAAASAPSPEPADAARHGLRRESGDHEVDRVANRLDPGGLLLGHPDPVGVLELHDELVEIERVGVEVLLEARRVVDRVGLHLELVRKVLAHLRQHVVPVHAHVRPSFLSRIAPRVAPDASRSSAVRSTARSSTARAASRTAFAIPSGPALPWPTTATPRSPSRMAPPVASGSMRRLSPPSAGRSRRPPSVAIGPERAASRTASATARAVPSIVFSATLPVKPSVTTTSAIPASRSRPSRLPRKSIASARASSSWASTTSAVPFFGSSPTESSATRGRSTPSTARLKAAPR